MVNKYLKKLRIMLIVITVTGLLLLSAAFTRGNLIDHSIILNSSQMIFLLLCAIILLVVLIIVLFSLNAKRKYLERIYEQKIYPEEESDEEPQRVRSELPTKEEVEAEKREITKASSQRFFMLNKIDQTGSLLKANNDTVNLEEICNEFRQYSANSLGLFYDIKDIRRFVGGLSVGHIMILQGMSGTGKTSLAYAFGEYLNNSATIVPIQPMWKERTDLIGYYNEFTKKFNETTLLQKLYEASQSNQIYIIVLDEMNIARVEYYFAEFLSLLEIPDVNKRYLDVVTDVWDTDPVLLQDGKIILPNNMWFVGTANNDDSTFAISDKVYDRAMVINLDKRANRFISTETKERSVTSSRFEELIETAKLEYEISYRNLRRIKLLDNYLMEHFHITFGNRIMQQIINYVPVIVASGGTELDALDDIMSKKVLRKLETKNMVYVKNAAPGLISYIHELFGSDEMSQCIEYIQNVEINA